MGLAGTFGLSPSPLIHSSASCNASALETLAPATSSARTSRRWGARWLWQGSYGAWPDSLVGCGHKNAASWAAG